MRILQLTNKMPYPPKDGGAIATLNISRGLARMGHDITILGMNTSKHYVDLKEIPDDLTKSIKIEAVKVDTNLCFWAALKNLLFSRNPYNAERFFNENFKQRLIELLSQNEFDVIQLEGLYMAYYISTIRKYSKAKIALRAHNIEHEIWERTAQQEKRLPKKLYLRMLARRIKQFKLEVLNTYDLLIPITARDARQFEYFGNNKPCHTVPFGFDAGKLTPQPEKIKFPSVFFIGTLDWFPNQEGLIWFLDNVWGKILEAFPQLQFQIAGRNAPEWIQKKFTSLPNVNYLGEIDDAHAYMNENAVMVVPLFSGSGMRVKIIEGMAMGKTIVTTTIGAEGIDVTHEKDIIIEDDAHKFASHIIALINNPEWFKEIGREAVRFVGENFDNQKISASLADFYKNQL